jgi:hypothetical protein
MAVAALACAGAATAAAPALPAGAPLYFDYATDSVLFRNELFKRPGLILTMDDVPSKKGDPAAEFRAAGAVTVYWDEHIEKIVGTPSAPADPATVGPETATLAATAMQSSGCQQPLVALNELVPPGNAPAAKVAQYRQNVLALMRGLVDAGAAPVLLLPFSTPTAAGPAADFLEQAAGLGPLVVEVYFNNNRLFGQGPLLASRTIRLGIRARVGALTALGIPVSQIGVMLGFQSGTGQDGREGLQPTASWLEMVKLNALSARQVASDTGIPTIWSWGWGTFNNAGSADPDKPFAACVYLWARDQTLCDAPSRAQFDTDLTEGLIDLAPGAQCEWSGGEISLGDFRRLRRALDGDQARALSALLERAADQATARVRGRQVRAAERAIVAKKFGGSARRYARALRRFKLGRPTARAIVADQLAQRALAKRLAPQTYAVWLAGQEQAALTTAVCLLDQLPTAGDVDLTRDFPFLRLPAPRRSR